jgi:hypothetical protein
MKTSSRRHGRVAAVGSVRRPSPGCTGMNETRRFETLVEVAGASIDVLIVLYRNDL